MPLWEVSLRIREDYPFNQISAKYPDTPISMWCIWNRELVQVPTRDETILKGVEAMVRKSGYCVDRWQDSSGSRVYMLKCTCDRHDSIWNVLGKYSVADAPPTVFRDGWAHWRFLSFDDEDTRAIFKDLNRRGPTELLRKREISLSSLPSSVWVTSLFSDLTQKQADAVLKAHRHGYYSSPRQITTEAVAKGVGVSRSTFEEHLRKAENQIMHSLIPYLQLFVASGVTPEMIPARSGGGAKDKAEA
jgi:hypothetical protein